MKHNHLLNVMRPHKLSSITSLYFIILLTHFLNKTIDSSGPLCYWDFEIKSIRKQNMKLYDIYYYSLIYHRSLTSETTLTIPNNSNNRYENEATSANNNITSKPSTEYDDYFLKQPDKVYLKIILKCGSSDDNKALAFSNLIFSGGPDNASKAMALSVFRKGLDPTVFIDYEYLVGSGIDLGPIRLEMIAAPILVRPSMLQYTAENTEVGLRRNQNNTNTNFTATTTRAKISRNSKKVDNTSATSIAWYVPLPFYDQTYYTKIAISIRENLLDISNVVHIENGKLSFLRKYDQNFAKHPSVFMTGSQLIERLNAKLGADQESTTVSSLLKLREYQMKLIPEISYFYTLTGLIEETVVFTDQKVLLFFGFNLRFLKQFSKNICPPSSSNVLPKGSSKSKPEDESTATIVIYDSITWLRKIIVATSHGVFYLDEEIFGEDFSGRQKNQNKKDATIPTTYVHSILKECVTKLTISENFRSSKIRMVAASPFATQPSADYKINNLNSSKKANNNNEIDHKSRATITLFIADPNELKTNMEFVPIHIGLSEVLFKEQSNNRSRILPKFLNLEILNLAVTSNLAFEIGILVNVTKIDEREGGKFHEQHLIIATETHKSYFEFRHVSLPKTFSIPKTFRGSTIVRREEIEKLNKMQTGKNINITMTAATYNNVVFPTSFNNKMYILGSQFIETDNVGDNLTILNEYAASFQNLRRVGGGNTKTSHTGSDQNFINVSSYQHRIDILSFANQDKKGYHAFLNTNKELWFTTSNSDQIKKIHPSPAWDNRLNEDCDPVLKLLNNITTSKVLCLDWPTPPDNIENNETYDYDQYVEHYINHVYDLGRNSTGTDHYRIVWIIPISVYFDLRGDLYEVITYVETKIIEIPAKQNSTTVDIKKKINNVGSNKKLEVLLLGRRFIPYADVIQTNLMIEESIVSSSNYSSYDGIKKSSSHDEIIKTSSTCPFNKIRYRFTDLHGFERKMRYIFRPPRHSHPEGYQTEKSFIYYHALSHYIVNEDIFFKDPYVKQYVSTLEKWVQSIMPSFVNTTYLYQNQLLNSPSCSSCKLSGNKTNKTSYSDDYRNTLEFYYTFRDIANYEYPANILSDKLPQIIYMDKSDTFSFIMLMQMARGGNQTRKLDINSKAIGIHFGLSLNHVLAVNSSQSFNVTQNRVETKITIYNVGMSVHSLQAFPGQFLLPMTFSIYVQNSDLICFESGSDVSESTNQALHFKGSDVMQIMVGCPPKTALIFDWERTKSQLKKFRPCPNYPGIHDMIMDNDTMYQIPCLYFYQEFKPYFTVVDYVGGISKPYAGNYTYRVVGGFQLPTIKFTDLLYNIFKKTNSEEPPKSRSLKLFYNDIMDMLQTKRYNREMIHVFENDELFKYNWQMNDSKFLIWGTNLSREELVYRQIPGKTENTPIFNSQMPYKIKWFCQPYSPCGNNLTSPTFPPINPEYFMIIEISNFGLAELTYCDYTMRFIVRLHGIPLGYNASSWNLLLLLIILYFILFPLIVYFVVNLPYFHVHLFYHTSQVI